MAHTESETQKGGEGHIKVADISIAIHNLIERERRRGGGLGGDASIFGGKRTRGRERREMGESGERWGKVMRRDGDRARQ